MNCKDKELFLVVTNDVEQNQSWLIDTEKYKNKLNGGERDAEVIQLKDIVCDVTVNPLCNDSYENCNHFS